MSQEKEAEQREFRKGDILFREGDFEMWMYEILSGQIGIYTDYGCPSEKLLRTLGQWDCFGEMGLISSMARSATAVALEKTKVRVIDGNHFDAFFHSRPETVYKIMQQMSDRIRSLTEEYTEACDTIAEYLEAEEEHRTQSESVLKKMAKFVGLSGKGKNKI